MLKIDSHHHLWRFNPDEYSWLVDPIRRDFLPADLQRELSSSSIDAAITVQARQTLEETRWLLELAAQNDFIKGVVGWVPLIDPNIAAALEQFSAHPKLRAVRHVLQDESDDNYILRPDFNRGISLLAHHKLAYDILIFERHLPQTIRFVDQHPNQIFVLDHLAKPRVKLNEISPWRENISELAKRPNVYCKLSGLATEADHANWTTAQFRPYIDTVLDAFGPKRLTFGSDWPVCLLAVSYQRWAEIVQAFIAQLSTTEQQRIWSETAIEAYNLPAAKQYSPVFTASANQTRLHNLKKMSPETQALQQFFQAVNRNDIEAITKDFHPDIVRIEPEGFPTAGTYRGIAEVQEHVRKGRGTWAEGTCDPEKFLVNGDKVVVYLHVRVRLHGATDWVDGRFADGFLFRNGKILQYLSFGKRAEALQWAGIEDPEAT